MDALSDDETHGITAIAFIGSVFSPYYAWARRHGPAEPGNHCALNVALYRPRGGRWAMTERGMAQVARDSASLAIGPSSLRWTGSALEINVDEVCAPLPRRLRGSIRVMPAAICERTFALDDAGRHRWTPFAARARINVDFAEPSLSWSGSAYIDGNAGDEPLENEFKHWTWARASSPERTVVQYDTLSRSGKSRTLGLQFTGSAEAERIELPAQVPLPRTRWRIARQTRNDAGHEARVIKTLEDAPFYSRSLVRSRLMGSDGIAFHESLSLDRFRSPWVQWMLPFRMPRIARR